MAHQAVPIILFGLALILSPALSAQDQQRPAPRLSDGKPDLSGVWQIAPGSTRHHFSGVDGGGRAGRVEAGETTAEALMRPEAREKYQDQLAAGKARTIERDLYDPTIKACAPLGFMRLIQQGRPVEILNVPNRLFFRYEVDHWPRDIWMDGRSHPDPDITPPTWMGHSIGSWDGDTLVVDTVGFNDLTVLDSPGHPHSDQLHTIERYTRTGYDRLEIQVTFDDPEIYTKPVVGNTFVYRLIPDGEIVEWIACDDRIRELMNMDVCKIKEAWEFEAVCRNRENGESPDYGADVPKPGY